MNSIVDNIKTIIATNFNKVALSNSWQSVVNSQDIVVEEPKQQEHGDFSTNIAMVQTKQVKKAPFEIAQELIKELQKEDIFSAVEFAKPGFINFSINSSYYTKELNEILAKKELYCKSDKYKGNKVLVEFVSANPTGPLHVGHVRGAVVGDVLANMLDQIGYSVLREYYVNDAGSQIKVLAQSLFTRYKELFNISVEHGKNFYPGEYLIDLAKELKDEIQDSAIALSNEEFAEKYGTYAVNKILNMIKQDLDLIGVKHDSFVSEKEVTTTERHKAVEQILKKNDNVYYGMLEKPKSADDNEDYEPLELKLFRSTKFGDDSDRALERSDGSLTYFGNDVVYHYNKYERGYLNMVDILGADHAGYAKRVKASVIASSEGKANLDVTFCALVKLLKDGKPFKMSKRAGNFILLKDLALEVEKDVIRTIMITRKNEAPLNLDIDELKEQNSNNPVFYIKYAYARVCSVKRNVKEAFGVDFLEQDILKSNKDLLKLDIEKNIIKTLSLFNDKIEQAVIANDPNRFYNYVYSLASLLHNYWSIGKQDGSARVIQQDNIELTKARLALLDAFKVVFEVSLSILGVNLLEEM